MLCSGGPEQGSEPLSWALGAAAAPQELFRKAAGNGRGARREREERAEPREELGIHSEPGNHLKCTECPGEESPPAVLLLALLCRT